MHSRVYRNYVNFVWNATESEEQEGQPQCWKSIHRTDGVPEFNGHPYAVHEGYGMKIHAPRPHHNVISLEVAHKRTDHHHVMPMNSTRIIDLVESYMKCMA
jgi:hypothetical protein